MERNLQIATNKQQTKNGDICTVVKSKVWSVIKVDIAVFTQREIVVHIRFFFLPHIFGLNSGKCKSTNKIKYQLSSHFVDKILHDHKLEFSEGGEAFLNRTIGSHCVILAVKRVERKGGT